MSPVLLSLARRQNLESDTLKKVMVAPSSTTPYRILVCLARSSAESMGDSILSTVRKAAKLAVYEEMMMRVKNHQMPPTIRVDRALGMSSEPGVRELAGINIRPQKSQQVVIMSLIMVWMLMHICIERAESFQNSLINADVPLVEDASREHLTAQRERSALPELAGIQFQPLDWQEATGNEILPNRRLVATADEYDKICIQVNICLDVLS